MAVNFTFINQDRTKWTKDFDTIQEVLSYMEEYEKTNMSIRHYETATGRRIIGGKLM